MPARLLLAGRGRYVAGAPAAAEFETCAATRSCTARPSGTVAVVEGVTTPTLPDVGLLGHGG